MELPESAFAVASDRDDTVWVARLEGRVFAVDTATVTMTVDVGAAPRGVAVGAGAVWVTVRDDREIVRIDPSTGEVDARIRIDGRPWPIAFGDGFVWAAEMEGGSCRSIPRRTVSSARPMWTSNRGASRSLGAIWVAHQPGTVTRLPLPR